MISALLALITMKRLGARLTVSGALGRQSSLEPLQMSTETNSAVLSKAEREIKVNFSKRSAWPSR